MKINSTIHGHTFKKFAMQINCMALYKFDFCLFYVETTADPLTQNTKPNIDSQLFKQRPLIFREIVRFNPSWERSL